jgi:hypothetical protein
MKARSITRLTEQIGSDRHWTHGQSLLALDVAAIARGSSAASVSPDPVVQLPGDKPQEASDCCASRRSE